MGCPPVPAVPVSPLLPVLREGTAMKHSPRREVEKFKECRQCGSKNTVELTSTQEEIYRFVYFGWCRSCEDVYDYSLRVDIVWDKEGRI